VDPNHHAATRQLLAANSREKRHCEQSPGNGDQLITKMPERRHLNCRRRARLNHEAWYEIRPSRQVRNLAGRFCDSKGRNHRYQNEKRD
jgi:hypothetical protein